MVEDADAGGCFRFESDSESDLESGLGLAGSDCQELTLGAAAGAAVGIEAGWDGLKLGVEGCGDEA